jgi:hypothetical protein
MKKRTCIGCGAPCDEGSRTGLCRPCWTPTPKPDRFCACGTKLGRANKSGLCKLCVCRRNHADPELHAKFLAAMAASNADPVLREKRAAACRVACRTAAERERRSELGKRSHHKTIHSAKAKARAFTPEAIALRSAARVVTMAEKRRRREAASAAQAERERLRHDIAGLTPFERQMARVRAGAGIVEIRPMRQASPSYSLTGSGMAMF